MINIRQMSFYRPFQIEVESESQKNEIVQYLTEKGCEKEKDYEIHKDWGWLMVSSENVRKVVDFCLKNKIDFQFNF